MTALQADTYRQFGRCGWLLVARGFFLSRTFRVIVTLRLCQRANAFNAIFRPFALWPIQALHQLASSWAGIDLSWRTAIGPGIALTHGWGLVINPSTRIGSNVTLFHGVTLGQRDRIDVDGTRVTTYPVIEDEVWIGPHAIIAGGITVGKGSRIAGGALVLENVPPYSLVIGNPGQVVKSNCTADVYNRCEF